MKFEDPIKELRNLREVHSARFDHDLERIVEDIQQVRSDFSQKGWRFVKRRKKANHSVELTELKHPKL